MRLRKIVSFITPFIILLVGNLAHSATDILRENTFVCIENRGAETGTELDLEVKTHLSNLNPKQLNKVYFNDSLTFINDDIAINLNSCDEKDCEVEFVYWNQDSESIDSQIQTLPNGTHKFVQLSVTANNKTTTINCIDGGFFDYVKLVKRAQADAKEMGYDIQSDLLDKIVTPEDRDRVYAESRRWADDAAQVGKEIQEKVLDEIVSPKNRERLGKEVERVTETAKKIYKKIF